MAKLADAADLGSAAARRKGSTPFPCTFLDLATRIVGVVEHVGDAPDGLGATARATPSPLRSIQVIKVLLEKRQDATPAPSSRATGESPAPIGKEALHEAQLAIRQKRVTCIELVDLGRVGAEGGESLTQLTRTS